MTPLTVFERAALLFAWATLGYFLASLILRG